LALGLHVGSGITALVLAAAKHDPRWLFVYALALALSAAWGSDWRVALVGTVAGPVVLPVLALGYAAAVVLAAPDFVAKWLGFDESEPSIDPTVVHA